MSGMCFLLFSPSPGIQLFWGSMPAGKLVFSGMDGLQSSSGGNSAGMSVCRGTRTGGKTGDSGSDQFCTQFGESFNLTTIMWNTQQLRTLTWCLHPLVVIGVDTYFILLGVKGKFTVVGSSEFMVGLQIRPAPQAAVDHMRKTFSVGNLQTSIQRPERHHSRNIKHSD